MKVSFSYSGILNALRYVVSGRLVARLKASDHENEQKMATISLSTLSLISLDMAESANVEASRSTLAGLDHYNTSGGTAEVFKESLDNGLRP
jgi:hypothetical protein